MKYISEYRNKELALALAHKIAETAGSHPMTFMEVCGTHTMAIARFGIRQLLPKTIRLLSGPGCPVCVTPNDYLDRAIALSRRPNTIVTTFGDMMKVPGSTSSLYREHAAGGDIRMVYSTIDALKIARENPDHSVVFLGVGFETTAPTIAASILQAEKENLKNYFVLSSNKVVPPALTALLQGDLKLDGFILPGHVSTIIGANAYHELAEKHTLAMAITGFEPTDILSGILSLVEQVATDHNELAISYRRAVNMEGNSIAIDILNNVFEPVDANWRGIGIIAGSGLKIREGYKAFDASVMIPVDVEQTIEPKGCICGNILTGTKTPRECPLFGNICTPDSPVGACMVSSEGTCAAWFKYGITD